MSTTFRRIPNPSSPGNNAQKLPDAAYKLNTAGDPAISAPAESFWLSYALRLGNEMYRRLLNKEPGNVTPREYASGGPGHDHDGVNSVFIGTTLCAHVRAPVVQHWFYNNAKDDRPVIDASFGGGITYFANPDAGAAPNTQPRSPGGQHIDDTYSDLMIWPDLYCGPGVNRLDVSVFAIFSEGGPDPAGRLLDFRLTTGSGNVDRTVTVPNNSFAWAHYHLTNAAQVVATANALNDLTLRVKCPSPSGSDFVALYGWSITGAHA